MFANEFADLLSDELQPRIMDAKRLPDIQISEGLRRDIQQLLAKEEGNYVKVSDKTAVVQRDKNYIFFSNQWLYLAVCCKKYAEALKVYGDYFDTNIRGNQALKKALAAQEYDTPLLTDLIPDETDKERMIGFIKGGDDHSFRPGKALVNSGSNSSTNKDTIRGTKDVIGSCVLKKVPVPDASSGYLGDLIYYLTNNPDLYNALEREVKSQIENADGVMKLSSVAKDCAKQIIDCIYKIDKFKRISGFFVNTGMSVKIDTRQMGDLLPAGTFLRYVFALPASTMYAAEFQDDKSRVFADKDYEISLNDENVVCRLTTEWKGSELEENADGNFLKALIIVVNNYYEGIVEIKNELEDNYLFMYKDEFKMEDLPGAFKSDYSRRFITSLLAKPFVILTGNSGTGKTRIARQFSEYLEVTFDDNQINWLIVPVGADWTDNAKVLGFYNPLADGGKGCYEKTEIVRLIELANTHRKVPFFLILDEMNLSHVERYFSDFLSHMEVPDSEFKLDGYDGVLEFPQNLFVIGTVNIDETTYMFSPKVLDRANVIEFRPEKDDVLALFTLPVYTAKIGAANDGSAEAFLKLAKEIRSGKCRIAAESAGVDPMEKVQAVFDDVYKILEKRGFEFAYRTVREIRQYIAASFELDENKSEFNINAAIDQQLVQKVLPKIHGNRKEIGELLDELESICRREDLQFDLSAKKIEQMKGKLATVQYASFI